MNAATHTPRTLLDRAADRVLSLDSVVYGDERQQRVTLESCALGWTLGIYTAQIGAVIATAVGAIGTSLALFALTFLMAVSANWYAGRRQVDFGDLARRDRRMLRRSQIASLVLVGLWCALLARQAYTGHPLIPLPDLFTVGGSDTVAGMAVGGAIGAVAGAVVQWVARRRRPATAEVSEPDDEF